MSKSGSLVQGWKITDKGDDRSPDKVTDSSQRRRVEVDPRVPELEEFIHEGTQKVIDLFKRWFFWAGNNARKEDVLWAEAEMGGKVEGHQVDRADGLMFPRSLVSLRVKPVDEDAEHEVKGAIHFGREKGATIWAQKAPDGQRIHDILPQFTATMPPGHLEELFYTGPPQELLEPCLERAIQVRAERSKDCARLVLLALGGDYSTEDEEGSTRRLVGVRMVTDMGVRVIRFLRIWRVRH